MKSGIYRGSLISGSWDNTIRLCNTNTGDCRVFEGHADNITFVAFSPDNKHIASASDDSTLRLWDAKKGKELTRFAGIGPIRNFIFSNSGKTLTAADIGGGVHVFDIWRDEVDKKDWLERFASL